MSYFPRDGQAEFLERACDHRILTRTEERELALRIEKGDHEAKQTLIEHNIKLAVQIARRYQNSGVLFEDLCQEGFIGLNRAAEKFDWRTGYKFSTYATWWVRHMIQRAIHKDRNTIRIPGHIIERQRKIDKYLREVNPDADDQELSDALEIKLHHVTDARSQARVVASMDAPLTSDDDSGDWHAIIADEAAPDPAEMIADSHEPLTLAMADLEEIERDVIRLRFGFDGPVLSREDTAAKLGVKPHVVQRAQRAGIAKLRRDPKLQSVVQSLTEEEER